MSRIAIDGTDYRGRTSRPAGSTSAVIPYCSRCGSSLGGRLEEVRRGPKYKVFIWLCGCGRRRRLRYRLKGAAAG